jgi:hypothetical protein
MADIQSYADLVSVIQNVAEDDGSEFTSYIPYAISLAEQRLNRELDLPDLEIAVTGTLSATINTLPKPSGYRFANYFHIINSLGAVQVLKKRREDYINDYWPNPSLTATPKYYADQSATTFQLAPIPDVSYQYRIKYTAEPNRLGVSTQTNYFTQRCVDILYAAAMVEMTIFMKAWQQITIWEQAYKELKDGWNLTMARNRKDDGETQRNPDNPINTVENAPKTGA